MTRILIAHRDTVERQALRQGLTTEGTEVIGLARDGQEAVQMALQLQPDVTLLDVSLSVLDGFQAAEMIGLARPGAVTLLLGADVGVDTGLTADTLRQAMQAGARDVVFPQGPAWAGADLSALRETVRRVMDVDRVRETPEFRNVTDPERMPMTISISGAKGGVGKTTLCVNLAVALAQGHPGEVVLVDLYSQFGDVATLLNLQPERTLVDLVSVEGELDLALVEEHLETHESGLKVLVGSVQPQPLDLFSTTFLERVMGILKRRYRFIVVDVPPFLHSGTLYMLSHSQAAVLVANLFDLTTASDTQKLLQTLRGGYVPPERLHVVLNRVSRQNQLQVPDLEKALEQPVAGIIPNDGKIVPASINAGVPFVITHPHSAVSESIRTLARCLCRPAVAGREALPDAADSRRATPVFSKWELVRSCLTSIGLR
jgi:pilus assembly protein CpaE